MQQKPDEEKKGKGEGMSEPAKPPREEPINKRLRESAGDLPEGLVEIECGGKGDCGYRALGYLRAMLDARKAGKRLPDPKETV